MDKREAKMVALGIAASLLEKEIKGPSGLTIPGESDMVFTWDDQTKVLNALEEIRRSLIGRIRHIEE